MIKKYKGYHGTKLCNAEKIISDCHFKPSTKKYEWLGAGVYFFEEHLAHAVNWCLKARQYKEYAVLSVILEVEKEYQLDLTNPEDWAKFLVAKKMLKRQIGAFVPKYRDKNVTDGLILNYMAKKCGLKLVRQSFVTPPYQEGYQQHCLVPTQIQLCVKNEGCIRYETLKIEVSEVV